jgi:hypothetical protein
MVIENAGAFLHRGRCPSFRSGTGLYYETAMVRAGTAMVTQLITEKRLRINNWMWRQRLERQHSELAGLLGDGGQVRLLLGVRGSGVDYLGRLISQPGFPLRYYHNLLQNFDPPLSLNSSGDRLAVPFTKVLDERHPLIRVLRMTQEFHGDWALERISNKPETEQWESLPAVVKSSHALLAAEAILRGLQCKALLYVSDPVKAVDQLFAAGGLDSPYLLEEGRSVLAPYFLGRFLRKDYARIMHAYRRARRVADARRENVLHRVLVIALIQHMFRMLAARYPQQAIVVEYDRIADDPTLMVRMLEQLLGETGLQIGHSVMVESTFSRSGEERILWKNDWPEKKPSFGFLTPEEVRASYRLLQECGLASRIRDQNRYRSSSGVSRSA